MCLLTASILSTACDSVPFSSELIAKMIKRTNIESGRAKRITMVEKVGCVIQSPRRCGSSKPVAQIGTIEGQACRGSLLLEAKANRSIQTRFLFTRQSKRGNGLCLFKFIHAVWVFFSRRFTVRSKRQNVGPMCD